MLIPLGIRKRAMRESTLETRFAIRQRSVFLPPMANSKESDPAQWANAHRISFIDTVRRLQPPKPELPLPELLTNPPT